MKKIININDNWFFSKNYYAGLANINDDWEKITIPHTWNGIDGQDGGRDYARGVFWYCKEIEFTELNPFEITYLEFRGVNSSCDVYVNNVKLSHHDGGYSIFRVNISDAIIHGKNMIMVAVDNSPSETVYPQVADFTFYGGIYRDVNIISVSQSHFDIENYGSSGIRITPEIAGYNANVYVDTTVCGDFLGHILCEIKDAEGRVVASRQENVDFSGELSSFGVEMQISDVHLWNGRKDPYLYSATLTLINNEGKKEDEVSSRFGVRSFFIDPEKGFFLNGEFYPLHGVSRHQDRADIGNALLPKHHEEDMDLICEVGANTIRLAHYQHDQYFYDLCDERGMIVWAEIPYISKHMPGGRENTISQMKELVIQNYNHPSIVVWGLSNEITLEGKSDDLYENHVILNNIVHDLDKTRKTVMAIEKNCDIIEPVAKIPDVVSYNMYIGWYEGFAEENGALWDAFHKKDPSRPFGLSEYGADAMDWHTNNPRKGDYTEEYQSLYHEILIKQIIERPYMWATHVWNMFDFGADNREEGGQKGKNCKGLVTIDRKYKKDAFYAYKAWLSDEPFVHICGARYVDRHEEETTIKVYTNQSSVSLYVNGKLVGINDTDKMFFTFTIPNKGESIIRAVAGNCEDCINIRKVNEPNETYIMKDAGVLFNWFDLNAPEGFYSVNNTIGEIMKSEKAKEASSELLKYVLPGIDANNEEADGYRTIILLLPLLKLSTLINSGNYGFSGNITKEMLLEINDALNKIEIVKE